jgi:tetratricopeptide (TPR) repeat protein
LAARRTSLGPEHPQLAPPLILLAEVHIMMGDFLEAEREARQALAVAGTKPLQACANTVLGNVLRLTRRYKEAEAPYQTALAILEEIHSSDHRQVAAALMNLAGLYRAQKRHKEAEVLISKAQAMRRSKAEAGPHTLRPRRNQYTRETETPASGGLPPCG